MTSEDDLEAGESEFGSMDELSSPDEPRRPQNQHFDQDLSRQSMPPPSMIMQPMPQPMLAPSQLIQPQMLSQM